MNAFDIIFAGTPAFSAVTLQALLQSQHHIKAVYTQPDRPAGRGRKVTPSAVKELAVQQGLSVYQPLSLRDEREQAFLASLQADIMIVVAYGLLLPTAVLTAPRFGCLNIHASLLPRWRGAAPIQRAILAGDTLSGVTIMQMDAGLDTGPMLYKVECPIQASDTSATLHDRLAVLGAKAILYTLDHLTELTAESQDHTLASYAQKIKKEEAEIDWTKSAEELSRQVRAFNPWPVAVVDGLRIWEAEPLEKKDSDALPGTIVQTSAIGIDVATGAGVLRLLKLQLPGGKVLSVAEVLNARKNEFGVGHVLGKSA